MTRRLHGVHLRGEEKLNVPQAAPHAHSFFAGFVLAHVSHLDYCSITDDDVEAGYLAACLDAAGPQNILGL